jgi:endonuclease YncB( thermonuclease family)
MNNVGDRNVVPGGERNVTAAAAVALLLLLPPGCGEADPRLAAAGRLSGRAVVTDGDTLRVAGRAVRFQGVAAPERSEKGGAAATAFVRRMAAGREVTCELDGTRTRGRVVGVCRVGGRDVASGRNW